MMAPLNDAATTQAYASAIKATVGEFHACMQRAATVLCLGVRGGPNAAAALAAGAAEVVIASLEPAELELAGRYLAAVGADPQRWSVLRRSPMQLAPAEQQYDVLILDHFGPSLNNHHAAVVSRMLWSRQIVRTFDEAKRYVVPVEAAATIRLCGSPELAATADHVVASTGELLAPVRSPPPHLRWRGHPGEVTPRSARIEVFRERYDTAELDAIEWPAAIPAPPGPWASDAVLLLEWAVLLHPDQPALTTTATELQTLSPRDRAARVAVWGPPQVCSLPPGPAPPALTVSYRPGHGVALGIGSTPPSADQVHRQLPAARHAKIADVEFARACKVDNSASDL